MPRLADVPPGTQLMVDANILAYHFTAAAGVGLECQKFVSRVENGELAALVTTTMLAECLHRLLLWEAAVHHSLPQAGILKRLQQHPDLVKPLSLHADAIKQIPQLGFQIVPVTIGQIFGSHSPRQLYGLLTNDSILLSVMIELGVADLATNDADFDSVSGIRIWKPV